jgi:hypothetical protein
MEISLAGTSYPSALNKGVIYLTLVSQVLLLDSLLEKTSTWRLGLGQVIISLEPLFCHLLDEDVVPTSWGYHEA